MQGEAFAWLGRFYADASADLPRAQKCFQRALALDPTQAEAGISPPHPHHKIVCRLIFTGLYQENFSHIGGFDRVYGFMIKENDLNIPHHPSLV